MHRPRVSCSGTYVGTKNDAVMIDLLGEAIWITEGVGFRTPAVENLRKFYEFRPLGEDEEGKALNALHEAGDFVSLMRHVKIDALRVMSVLSRYLDKDEESDPVVFVQNLMLDAGYDVPDWTGD